MRTVYITSGPRGSGKSTYAQQVIRQNPALVIVSKDEIAMRAYGKTCLADDNGEARRVIDAVMESARQILELDTHVSLILDCWNGSSRARKYLISQMRRFGADRIIC